ncbi:MAG: hypothetical protein JSV58_05270 [Candidatus Bathyarchaeota archaeon]|nr:MAG: hypothetical protein JSV58_05270 [Candidatus Bathyarchaeota archaeon]
MPSSDRDDCFGAGPSKKDYMGIISFGMFLIIVGILFVANPSLFTDLVSWIQSMADAQELIRPNDGLISSAVLFFLLIGLSNFLEAGIKFWTRVAHVQRRVIADILTGVALLLMSYLVSLYGSHELGWQLVIGIEAIAIGLLVVLYSIVKYTFRK